MILAPELVFLIGMLMGALVMVAVGLYTGVL